LKKGKGLAIRDEWKMQCKRLSKRNLGEEEGRKGLAQQDDRFEVVAAKSERKRMDKRNQP